MTPKTKFSREEIIDAAFEIAREEGFSGVTARNVAKRLGSSVAPIYVNFETIDDLIEALVQQVFAVSKEILAKQKGANLFENIGKASLEFARKYPFFTQELIIKPNPYMASYETVEKGIIEALAKEESMRGWTIDERKRLFFKMRAFQTGLQVMISNGHVPSWLDDQDIEELFLEVGEDLLQVQKIKRKENKS